MPMNCCLYFLRIVIVCLNCLTTYHDGQNMGKLSECMEKTFRHLNDAIQGKECVRFLTRQVTGVLLLTNLPGVRSHVVNHNTYPGQNMIFCQKTRTQEYFFLYFNHERMFIYWAPLNIHVSLYKYTTNYHWMENNR